MSHLIELPLPTCEKEKNEGAVRDGIARGNRGGSGVKRCGNMFKACGRRLYTWYVPAWQTQSEISFEAAGEEERDG